VKEPVHQPLPERRPVRKTTVDVKTLMQLAGDSDEDASEDLNVFDSEALYASDEMVEEASEEDDDEV